MTDLSPAAQAVLQAASIHHGLFNEEIAQRRRNIAVALRAAADHVYHDWSGFNCVDYLCKIAAELEGAQ